MLSMSTLALLATLAAEPSGVALEPGAARAANLLEGVTLDSSYRPSKTPPLRMTDELRFGLEVTPSLDDGGGISGDGKQIIALILGFFPGFGIGHLIARDRDGFIIFLIVDIVLHALWFVGWGALWWGPYGGLGGLVWLLVHIYQGYDAYVEAGGARLVDYARERTMRIASAPGRDENLASRLLGFAF
jgi:hypothetical protein